MRKKIVAGNWKMNNTLAEAQKLTSEIVHMHKDEVRNKVKVVLIPPFISISEVKHLVKGSAIRTGAQNCHHLESGAYTGEVSAPILASFQVEYVLVGHSERRQYFGENNGLLAEKTTIALKNNLIPVYCCGETLEERNSGNHFTIISQQISEGLFHLSNEEIQKTVVAYEPVWAIGTGMTASNEQAQEVHAHIRQELAKKYGKEIAENISILYGGSVKAANAAELFAQPDIDGGLIGGASLKSREFVDIIKAF